jgi:hypothetical protein
VLVTRLDEEVRGKDAVRGFVEEHHRVPVVHLRRFEEAQLVLADIDHLAVPVALDRATVVPSAKRKRAPDWYVVRDATTFIKDPRSVPSPLRSSSSPTTAP